MAHTNEVKTGIKPEPLVISRTFPAPRELVFKAWSTAEHMKRWFSPEGYTVPEAKSISGRAGSAKSACARPTGRTSGPGANTSRSRRRTGWCSPSAVFVKGERKFTAHTTVTFEEDGDGTA